MILNHGTKKRSNDRKNPRAAELWAAKKRAKNAERPKQVWVNGKWER